MKFPVSKLTAPSIEEVTKMISAAKMKPEVKEGFCTSSGKTGGSWERCEPGLKMRESWWAGNDLKATWARPPRETDRLLTDHSWNVQTLKINNSCVRNKYSFLCTWRLKVIQKTKLHEMKWASGRITSRSCDFGQ